MPSQEEIDQWVEQGIPEEEWFGRQIAQRLALVEKFMGSQVAADLRDAIRESDNFREVKEEYLSDPHIVALKQLSDAEGPEVGDEPDGLVSGPGVV